MDKRLIPILVIVAAIGLFLLVAWLKERRKNAQPTIQIKAELISIRLESCTVTGALHARNNIGHYVTFRTAEGELIELSASPEVGHMEAGTTGTLTYQGTKCERFEIL